MKNLRTLRWKTLLAGIALLLAGWLYVRLGPALDDSMARTPLLILGGLLVLLWIPVWVLLVSGLRWKPRLSVFVVVVVVEVAPFTLLRIDGFEGDILPQVSWKWEPRPGEVYDALESTIVSWKKVVPGAVDHPEFLGPDGRNHVAADVLPAGWTDIVPAERWRRRVGLGWSSFSVARGLAITQEQRGDQELVVAYSLEDGVAVWTHQHPARFTERMGGDGPRATPTIAGENVLVLGATGMLDCLDFSTGRRHWSHDVLAETGHGNLEWGKSGSPLVVGDLVVVTLGTGAGGSLAAFDLATGEPRWRAGEFEASYSTPVLRTLAGQEQLVVVYADHLAGHVVETGEMLWSTEIPRASANVANPVVLPGDRILVTIGYGKGSRLFEVARDEAGAWSVEQVWRSLGMKTKFTNVVVRGEHAYGLDEGRLSCMELATGRRVWKGTRWGHGQVLGVGEHLLLQAEDGEVVILEASPEGERVVGRFPALDGKTWNHPVLAGRHLLVRNDREAVCFVYPES